MTNVCAYHIPSRPRSTGHADINISNIEHLKLRQSDSQVTIYAIKILKRFPRVLDFYNVLYEKQKSQNTMCYL